MIRLFIIIILIPFHAFALDAVVTVLEAPVFRRQDTNSTIVQYLRKGQVIKVHPAIGKNYKFDEMIIDPQKIKIIKDQMKERGEFQDPLFEGLPREDIHFTNKFIPILDKQGLEAYILTRHVYVYFEDRRELSQSPNPLDDTDYRLEEPLPKNYPLSQETGYRGNALLGFSQPHNQSYPYKENVKTKGYESPVEIFFSFLYQPKHESRDRFYFGPSFRLRTFKNTFNFFDKRESIERYLQFGLGPIVSYDAYKGIKNRLNFSFAIHFQPVNYINITQSDSEFSESRAYRGLGFSSRLGVYYHRKAILENLDFVAGTSFDLEAPLAYQAQNGASKSDWWQETGSDKFQPKPLLGLTFSIGLQAAY